MTLSSLLFIAQAAPGNDSTVAIVITAILSTGGAGLVAALFKGYKELKELKAGKPKLKAESDKAVQEAASSVVTLLTAELEAQSKRFNERIEKLEKKNSELDAKNDELERRADNIANERHSEKAAIRRWSSTVEFMLKETGLSVPPLDDFLQGKL